MICSIPTQKMAPKNLFLLTILFSSMLVMHTAEADSHAFPQLKAIPMKYTPTPAESGKYMDLWVDVINEGTGPAEYVTCILDPKFPFSLDPNENATRIIGRIPAKNNAILQYTVRVDENAVEGWNELDIKCKYSDSNLWHVYKMRIYVQSRHAKLATGQITSKPSELLPNTDNNELDIGIVNEGNRNASYVKVTLDLPDGITPSNTNANVAYLGTIGAGSSKTAKFYIDIDKGISGWKNITAKITYSEINDNRTYSYTKYFTIPLYIRPLPEFDISIENNSFKAGSSGVLKLSIKNTGKKEAKSVSILVYKDYSQPFDFDNKYAYVGDLDPGETGDAALKFSIDQDAIPQSYKITLTIRYNYGDQVKTDTRTITIDVKQGDNQLKQNLIMYAIAGLVVIAAAYELISHRKRKKKA